MINLANSNITEIALGNNEIARAYIGSDLIYQKKNWVFQKKYKCYIYSTYKNTLSIKEGSHLIVLKQGEILFVDVIGGREEIASGGISSDDPSGDNANVIIYKDHKLTVKRGNFNTNTKKFTPSYTVAKNIETNYILHLELYTKYESSSEYEYYTLE